MHFLYCQIPDEELEQFLQLVEEILAELDALDEQYQQQQQQQRQIPEYPFGHGGHGGEDDDGDMMGGGMPMDEGWPMPDREPFGRHDGYDHHGEHHGHHGHDGGYHGEHHGMRRRRGTKRQFGHIGEKWGIKDKDASKYYWICIRLLAIL